MFQLSNTVIGGQIFSGLCLTIGLIVTICQMKKSKKKKCDVKSLDEYSYRELFHFFINEEDHYDKIHLAKEFSERMHRQAEIYMMTDHEDNCDFPDHFTYIEYEKEKVKEKLDYINERLFKEKYLDWLDEGQPVTSESRYWWAQTKLHLITYLIQRQPYHLTDGIWLRGVPQGPMSSIDAKLFSIFIDELGNGDEKQNHCNVYLNILNDLSLNIPSIYSKEFICQKQIMDISFQKPLLTLTTSLFPKKFYPEILGYTLWLETTSTAEHSTLRKLLERYNLNPKFSLLHTTIDNNCNGHGQYARDCVEKYLDDIYEKQGLDAVKQHWKRIWIGYVAYGTTGEIWNDLRNLFHQSEVLSPREEFIKLIEKKSFFAKTIHGNRRISPGDPLLNELFRTNQAEQICSQLENSKWIVKGNPRQSRFLNHVVSFNGPMYQVFTADELSIISRWIISLSPSTLNEMLSLILKRRKLTENLVSHVKLQLPDGNEEFLLKLFQGSPSDLLLAFRVSKWNLPSDGSNVTKDNVNTCQLIKSIENNEILSQIFDKNDEDISIIRKWILDGSPIPEETDEKT
ncbi:unnamed protein product, partial [Adineta ricciae]